MQQETMAAFVADQQTALAQQMEAMRAEIQQNVGLQVPTPIITRPGSVQSPEDARGSYPQTDLAGENRCGPPRLKLEYDNTDRGLYPAFKLQLQAEMERSASRIGTEADLVMYAFACLQGKAL
jgi:hypothetical protein